MRDTANKRKRLAEKGMPIVALVGYTNAGKSATMNYLLRKKEVESEDMLFQTLNTTAR
jgi:GTP-binding protein HflX